MVKKQQREQPTPHEKRIAAMTYRERLIFRLIRRIAHLCGMAKEFDAECDRIAVVPETELETRTARQIAALRAVSGKGNAHD